LREAIEHSHSNNLKLLVGCDSNAHHTSWGSDSSNNRGKFLFEFLIGTNILVFNRGSEPTFVTSRYRTIIDLTFGSPEVANLISDWKVSSEISGSDHRYITYLLNNVQPLTSSYRNPRKTDWGAFKDTLS